MSLRDIARDTVMRCILSAAALLLLSACSPSSPRLVLDCNAPFTKDASAASLAAHFGAANVTDEIIPGPEGSQLRATVIFSKDPARRVEVMFADETGRTGLLRAAVTQASTQWIGPGGVRMGTGMDAIERTNGKAFSLTGFDWDMSGYTTDWHDGTFAKQSPGCRVGMRFSPSAAHGMDILGEGPYKSDFAGMRLAAPKVVEFSIGYGFEAVK